MAKKSKMQKGTIAYIITCVALLLLTSAILSLLMFCVGKPKDSALTLSVDGVEITSDMELNPLGKTMTVNCDEQWTYKFVRLRTETMGNFVYFVNGKVNAASELSDISAGFDVVCKDDVLTVPDTDMLSVLKKYHNTVDVEISDAGMIKAVINTALVITSESGQSITLSFVLPILV